MDGKNFNEAVLSVIEEFDGSYRAKLTDEERAALGSGKTVEEVITGAMIARHSRLEITQAIKLAQDSSDRPLPENAEIYADLQAVTLLDVNGNETTKEYEVAACKAANIATGVIADETVVYNAYSHLEMSGETLSNLKTEIKSPDQEIFKEQETADPKHEGHIVKKSDSRDTVISTTIIPGSVQFPKELNDLNQTSINFRTGLLTEFIKQYKGCGKEEAIAIVRSMNRSYSENTFQRIYEKYYGKLDEGNYDKVFTYHELKSSFLANLSSIGSPRVSSEIIRVGLNLRKMSIAANPKWTAKARKVRQNGAKFYYVSSNLTTGIITVPTTSEILKNKRGEIANILDYSTKLLEKETRAEHGLKHDSIQLGTLITVPKTSVRVEDILQISDSSYSEVVTEYEKAVVNLADDICNQAIARAERENEEILGGILG